MQPHKKLVYKGIRFIQVYDARNLDQKSTPRFAPFVNGQTYRTGYGDGVWAIVAIAMCQLRKSCSTNALPKHNPVDDRSEYHNQDVDNARRVVEPLGREFVAFQREAIADNGNCHRKQTQAKENVEKIL